MRYQPIAGGLVVDGLCFSINRLGRFKKKTSNPIVKSITPLTENSTTELLNFRPIDQKIIFK